MALESLFSLCVYTKAVKDAWTIEVYGRISAVSDLHAADAIYHQQCSVDFRTLKPNPGPSEGKC